MKTWQGGFFFGKNLLIYEVNKMTVNKMTVKDLMLKKEQANRDKQLMDEQEAKAKEEQERAKDAFDRENTLKLVDQLRLECEGVADVNLVENINPHVRRIEPKTGWAGVASYKDSRLRCLARYDGDCITAYRVAPGMVVGQPSQAVGTHSGLTYEEFQELLSDWLIA